MASVNDVTANNAGQLALQAGQRPPQIRTESPPETQRPVPPTQGSRAQNGGTDKLTISPQAQALAAGKDNQQTESPRSEQPRATAPAEREERTRPRQGAAQYRDIQAQLSATANSERTSSGRTEQPRSNTVNERSASERLRENAAQNRETRTQAQTAANNDSERAASLRSEQRRNDVVAERSAPARLQQQGAAQYRALQALGAF
ncbi:MAG: hypothetical protein EPN21_17050 [Methylococcaceae bacterium]|nr:MAG: hypothetical protein EPN21_17050 [Methylococcaceae bacterium]